MVHTEPNADGIVYANCKGIQELPEDYPVPEVEINRVVFDCNNPDAEVFGKLWDRTQDKIRAGVNWDESSLGSVASNVEQSEEVSNDDIPF